MLKVLIDKLPWRLLLAGHLLTTLTASCTTMGGARQQTLTPEGKLDPPIYKAADYEKRGYCTTCRVEFETEAPEEPPAGALSLEIAGRHPDGVLHVALRMHGVPDQLFSVKGTLEIIRESGLQSVGLPLKYRGYRPGDLLATSRKRPCYDVNGALTSLIRFVGARCDPGEVPASLDREEGVLLVFSFDLVGAGDVRIRTTELLSGVSVAGLKRGILYGGVLRVRKGT